MHASLGTSADNLTRNSSFVFSQCVHDDLVAEFYMKISMRLVVMWMLRVFLLNMRVLLYQEIAALECDSDFLWKYVTARY